MGYYHLLGGTSTVVWVSTAAATSAVLGYYLGTWRASRRSSRKGIHALCSDESVKSTSDVSMYLVVLEDMATQSQSQLVDVSVRTVLGQFKKLYQRNEPILQEWDRVQGRKKIRLFYVATSSLLADVQASARSHMIPTHTFVTLDKIGNKHRRAVVVGPTREDLFRRGIMHDMECIEI